MSQRSVGNVVEIHGKAGRFHFSGSVSLVAPRLAWSGFSLGVTRDTHFAALLCKKPLIQDFQCGNPELVAFWREKFALMSLLAC